MAIETTPDRLQSHVYTLAGEIGEHNVFRPEALTAAADYIRQQWRSQGYTVTPYAYEVRGLRCENLEIERRGTVHPERIILLGAHYDSVMGCPGANDNGSGIAALLEISHLFTEKNPARTVRFVAFVNEEPPFFYDGRRGSLLYAKIVRERGDNIEWMASLETIGYYSDESGSQRYPPLFRFFFPNRGNFIAFVSDFRSRASMRRAVKAFRAHSDFPIEHIATLSFIPGVAWSDHDSFWQFGYRAFMITDTAFYRYAHYHTSGDTPEKLRYAPFARVTNGLFKAFASLAK